MNRPVAKRRAIAKWESHPGQVAPPTAPASGIPRCLPAKSFFGDRPCGFTLVEVFMVIAIMGILAAMVIPSLTPDVNTRLSAVADIVAADMAWARSLAVANNTNYTVAVDAASNLYYIEHSGTNSLFDALPAPPWSDYTDASKRRTTRLASLPGVSPPVRLAVAQKTFTAGPPQVVTSVEFGPLGQTTRSEPTVIWLAAGQGRAARYVPLTIDPITGLVTIGEITGIPPTAAEVLDVTSSG